MIYNVVPHVQRLSIDVSYQSLITPNNVFSTSHLANCPPNAIVAARIYPQSNSMFKASILFSRTRCVLVIDSTSDNTGSRIDEDSDEKYVLCGFDGVGGGCWEATGNVAPPENALAKRLCWDIDRESDVFRALSGPVASGPQITRRIGKSFVQLLTRRAVLIELGLAGAGGGIGWIRRGTVEG